MNSNFAYLSNGKLRFKRGAESPKTVESKFAETIRDRSLRAEQRHAWKSSANTGSFLSGPQLWGRAGQGAKPLPLSITSICRGKSSGEVLYTLETDSMCGVLSVQGFGQEEQRLWNNNTQMVTRLSANEAGDIACSVEHKNGTAGIGVRPAEGDIGLCEVTEGDSLDTAPRWVSGKTRSLVYQSAGIGRNAQGHMAGLGPFSINELNVDTGELSLLVANDKYDFLTPCMDSNENLYFIRRPYREIDKVSPLRMIKDIVLMPVRILVAIFTFFNIFSFLLTGKKLNTATEAPQKEMDIKQMMVWGRMMQLQKNARPEEQAPDMVPKSWELVRRALNGRETVLAKGVLAFDVDAEGHLLFTNGSAVFSIGEGDKVEKFLEDKMISQICFL